MQMHKQNAQTRKPEQEEMEDVTEKIAGKMFALVEEMMEQSGFLDAASLVKEHLNKSCSEEQSAAKKVSMGFRIRDYNL